jgi:hypothetical protein
VTNAVARKNDVSWDVTPCGYVRTDVSEELIASNIRFERIAELRTTLELATEAHCEGPLRVFS